MKSATTAVQMLIRLSGLILIVIGVLFWAGRTTMLSTHVVTGLVFVLLLWVLAFLGLRSGAGAGLATLNLLFGLVVLVLGMTQNRLLVGSGHWTIQVLHLLVGVAAIGLAESLAAKIKRAQPPAP